MLLANQTFKIGRYRLFARKKSPWQAPYYLGSTLRGAWGHALRDYFCETNLSQCWGCELFDSCPYANIFEPKDARGYDLSPLYVVNAPKPEGTAANGNTLIFELILIGPALPFLPEILKCWERAFQIGLGKDQQYKLDLYEVQSIQADGVKQTIWSPSQDLIDHPTEIKVPEIICNSATLRFATPVRFGKNGHTLEPDLWNAHDLILNLAQRIDQFFPIGKIPDGFFETAQGLDLGVQMQRDSLIRYSNRQQHKMELDAYLGELHLSGKGLSLYSDLIWLGQWLNLGKNRSFGLGRYKAIFEQKEL